MDEHASANPADRKIEAAAPVRGIAARPSPGQPVGEAEAALSKHLIDSLGVQPGDVLRLRSSTGNTVFTRCVASADNADDGVANAADMVRVGRLLWAQLLVKPGGRIEIEGIDAPAAAESVAIRPAFHLSHNLGHRVIDNLRENATLVWPGAKLFIPIFSGGGGVVVRIERTSATPSTVGEATDVTFEEPDPDIARRKASFAEVGGLDAAITRLRDLIELPLLRPGLYRSLGVRAPKGVLLYGPPGTGKTLLSRAVAEELGANIMKLPATELIGTYSGETEANLRALFNEAAHHAPTLVIIDEIDVIATSRGKLASQGDIRATTQLLTLMDGLEEVDGVLVLATTNRIDSIDEAFRRPGRFDEEIYVGPPDRAARHEILSIHTREMPLTFEAEAALSEIADAQTVGFTGADLMHLTREAGLAAARRITGGGSGFEIADAVADASLSVEAKDLLEGLDAVKPSAMRGLPVVDPHIEWDDIDGLDTVREAIRDAALDALREGPGRREGVLLSGGSGNGKSALVQALATHVGANYVLLDGSTIFTQWLGESEAALRLMFRKARDVAPAVVVLEHLDAVAPRRVSAHTEAASSRVLSALLSSVDEALLNGGIFVVGITNRPDMIDPALTRAGRLGLHLDIPNPDADRRRAIIARALGRTVDDGDVARLVEESAGESAADVERRALRESRLER